MGEEPSYVKMAWDKELNCKWKMVTGETESQAPPFYDVAIVCQKEIPGHCVPYVHYSIEATITSCVGCA